MNTKITTHTEEPLFGLHLTPSNAPTIADLSPAIKAHLDSLTPSESAKLEENLNFAAALLNASKANRCQSIEEDGYFVGTGKTAREIVPPFQKRLNDETKKLRTLRGEI